MAGRKDFHVSIEVGLENPVLTILPIVGPLVRRIAHSSFQCGQENLDLIPGQSALHLKVTFHKRAVELGVVDDDLKLSTNLECFDENRNVDFSIGAIRAGAGTV